MVLLAPVALTSAIFWPGLANQVMSCSTGFVRVVAEGHVGEAHVAAQQGQSAVGRGDRLLLGLHRHLAGRALELSAAFRDPRTIVADLTLPRPVAGLMVDFGHGAAVRPKFHVHERHGALCLPSMGSSINLKMREAPASAIITMVSC